MLTAIEQRLEERNLDDWEKLANVANKAAEMLVPVPGRRLH
ncbi:hypothetical protein SAMN05216228_103267 [Rhizobium tibeticum]|uniref:Uncharacterized protein n=1 Tax=Rhizobium tibeticum TaxID=501024 RepID=A0A1H8U9C3_9HYPH|nr:hypothetical protein RTCCBAU85039_5379 [Rhizobium tibeticum]SEO99453.1 hypothetical protein SAMN05216228_103267 [Rhizobium tibeticum]